MSCALQIPYQLLFDQSVWSHKDYFMSLGSSEDPVAGTWETNYRLIICHCVSNASAERSFCHGISCDLLACIVRAGVDQPHGLGRVYIHDNYIGIFFHALKSPG